MKLLLASLLLVYTVQSLPRFSRGLDDPGQFVMDPDEYGDGHEEIWTPDNDDNNGDFDEADPSGRFGDNENDDIPFESPHGKSRKLNSNDGNGRRGFLKAPQKISPEEMDKVIGEMSKTVEKITQDLIREAKKETYKGGFRGQRSSERLEKLTEEFLKASTKVSEEVFERREDASRGLWGIFDRMSPEELKEAIRKITEVVGSEVTEEVSKDRLKDIIRESIETAAQAVEKSKKSTRKGFWDINRSGPPPIAPEPWNRDDWKYDYNLDWENPGKYRDGIFGFPIRSHRKSAARKEFRDSLVDRSGPPPIVPQIPQFPIPSLTRRRDEDDWKIDWEKPGKYGDLFGTFDCFGVKIPTAPFGFRRKSAARKGFSETSLDPTDLDPPPFVPDYPIDLDEDEDLKDLESPKLHKSHRNLAFPDGRFILGKEDWGIENHKPVETEGRNHAEIKDEEPVKNRKLARRGGYVRKGSWWGWLTGGFPESGDTRGKDHM